MKRRFSLLSILIGLASLTWIFMAIVQWWIRYHDVSQFIFAVSIGVGGLISAIFYNWYKQIERNMDDIRTTMNSRLDVLYDEIQESKK